MKKRVCVQNYTVVPYEKIQNPSYIMMYHSQSCEALHHAPISYDDWESALSAKDSDEAYFFICENGLPIGWLKLNGLSHPNMSWLSMLVVGNAWRRQGAGTLAVAFAEEYSRKLGKKKICIRTTTDNIPAQNLYKKCSFEIEKFLEYITADGTRRDGIQFFKNLSIS